MKTNKYFKNCCRMFVAFTLSLLMAVAAVNKANAQQPTFDIFYPVGGDAQGQVILAYPYGDPHITQFTNSTSYWTSRLNCIGYTPDPNEQCLYTQSRQEISFNFSAPVTSFKIPMYAWYSTHEINLYKNGVPLLVYSITASQPCFANYALYPTQWIKINDGQLENFYMNFAAPGGFDRIVIDKRVGPGSGYVGPLSVLLISLDKTKYVVNGCNAGTAQISLSAGTLSNVCPAPLANLNTLVTSSTPANTNLVWYTTPDHSGNPVGDPTAVPLGTYYAFYYDPINFCFNTNASTAKVVVSQTICNTNTASGTIDCSKTQLYPAPIAGIPSQIDLIVTINVATAGCFTPITAGGSGFSITPGFTQKCVTSTGIQQLHIPVNYDGSTLGILNFTVGSAGSCTADLTKEPKDKIVKLWTLDNCTPINAGPILK